ncbi:hypothetical protein SDC9_121644 [bioreactor metagenome]|uniref:Uncharacterized protein n=1 Tax=bioreactor metagenome TaxID=1076179 RepID=A0A645CCJ4_9ZZZZ
MLQHQAVRSEGVDDALAQHGDQFGAGQPAAGADGDQDPDVVHLPGGGHLEHLLEEPATDVVRHRGHGQAGDDDGQPAVGAEQVGQRGRVARAAQRVADRLVDVQDGRVVLVRVHHLGAERQRRQSAGAAVTDQQGGGPLLDLEDESRS